MAKSKKKKSEDFKKVKLKIGKKLKKPIETDSTFKSGKVVLLEQLKRDATTGNEVPVTKRKLNLQDLLHHLRHYNSNYRKDGVLGLKELLNDNPQLIRSNLGTLIESLGPLFADSDSDILKATAFVWRSILTETDATNLSPYVSLLTAHLNCAMTHLNAEVKRAALRILGLLLTNHGDLFRRSVSSTSALIDCFLSSLPHSPQSTGSTTTTGSTAARPLMTRTSKHELLKLVKRIVAIFEDDTDDDEERDRGNRNATPMSVDCRTSSTAIVSISLSAMESNIISDSDDYVRALDASSNRMERRSKLINTVAPFCHALWIEITSTDDQKNVGGGGSVDCFTFDLETLIIMNDILFVYNSLLRRPATRLLPNSNNEMMTMDEGEWEAFKNNIRKTTTSGFIDRYHNLLPCRRAPRKSGDETRLAELELNADICSSVNFGLCRFLAYVSSVLESRFPYPIKEIRDYLTYSLSGEKKRIDSQTLRLGLELVRDLRALIGVVGSNVATSSSELRDHYHELGRYVMDALLDQNGRWKMKLDVIAWLCEDLENSDDGDWPRFGEFIERSAALMNGLVEETKKTSQNASLVFNLLFRLTRILLLRKGNLPLDEGAGKKAVECDLQVLLSNFDQYPTESRKELLNLLYYAAPLSKEIIGSIAALVKNRDGQEFDAFKKLLG